MATNVHAETATDEAVETKIMGYCVNYIYITVIITFTMFHIKVEIAQNMLLMSFSFNLIQTICKVQILSQLKHLNLNFPAAPKSEIKIRTFTFDKNVKTIPKNFFFGRKQTIVQVNSTKLYKRHFLSLFIEIGIFVHSPVNWTECTQTE